MGDWNRNWKYWGHWPALEIYTCDCDPFLHIPPLSKFSLFWFRPHNSLHFSNWPCSINCLALTKWSSPASFAVNTRSGKLRCLFAYMAKIHKDKVVFILVGQKCCYIFFLSQPGHLSLKHLISDGMCLQADNGLFAGWPGYVSYFRSRLLTQNVVREPWNISNTVKNLFFHWTIALEQKAKMLQNLFCWLLNRPKVAQHSHTVSWHVIVMH